MSSSSSSSLLRPKKKMRRDNNEGILTLLDLPISLLAHIFNHLGKTQEELMNLTLVSKQVYEICKNERTGIEWKIIPVFEISVLQQEGGGSTRTLVKNMITHSLNRKTAKKFRNYHHMLVKDLHKFSSEDNVFSGTSYATDIVHMEGITSLCTTSSKLVPYSGYSLLRVVAHMLPKLREASLSNMYEINSILQYFSVKCPLLEKVTSNNNVGVDPTMMRSSHNLKELYMDNTSFICYEKEHLADLTNHPDIFLFHQCCKSLERISIQNAKYYPPSQGKLSQESLIKFVRNAPPNLRWFRSDLSISNILMLRKERPGIELPFY
ncbi:hypothetical protein FRACYDRAFT_248057 [Fragilariopsis cylindrus CCMP1102]|uniref:F-box domain-containing protein n=1 Tax=Fragilariopsis cylindrus CCMP1102 TaxID=635003 RepID=A0A1E7EUU5_9STRA|nr:hypothetical protein FRACYDRAFT_248057 [Fragilariopsis cylindrus CCMP1102]|eukprot:OEU09800.1 hypothetical protein FRACYDRAFT_248057 [Fragilariopsis cylindrus CCMP1102]